MQFSTRDQGEDNDLKPTQHCAAANMGGWWYKACYATNLNGVYKEQPHIPNDYTVINWTTYRLHFDTLKYADMKLRPT